MQIDLNGFMTRLIIYLQQKYVVIHTQNILFSTTRDAHYKDTVFPDDEVLHATIKDADQCITCIPIKPKNMIHINCDLGFCDECLE